MYDFSRTSIINHQSIFNFHPDFWGTYCLEPITLLDFSLALPSVSGFWPLHLPMLLARRSLETCGESSTTLRTDQFQEPRSLFVPGLRIGRRALQLILKERSNS